MALVVKNPPADSIPESGRSPGGGSGNPLQYSCLAGYSPGVTKSRTRLKRLSMHTNCVKTDSRWISWTNWFEKKILCLWLHQFLSVMLTYFMSVSDGLLAQGASGSKVCVSGCWWAVVCDLWNATLVSASLAACSQWCLPYLFAEFLNFELIFISM